MKKVIRKDDGTRIEVEGTPEEISRLEELEGEVRERDVSEEPIRDVNGSGPRLLNEGHGFMPPPHANAETHEKVMGMLAGMTSREVFDMCVEIGIYTPDGELTKEYGGEG